MSVSMLLAAGFAAGHAWASSSPIENSLYAVQQTHQCSGVVTDESGEPLVGASVIVKGTTLGSVTDLSGSFSIKGVKKGATLHISYIGYETQSVTWDGSNVTITLKESTNTLEEAVVVGYGIQKKESLTGAMEVLKPSDLTDVTTSNVSSMLNGKVSGVHVAQGSGQPGSTSAVTVRGTATLSGSTAPLWVVDGVIVGNSADFLNPADIASMSILKDAASTAIYGSQGANGVIIVTTKGGKSGDIRVNISAKAGMNILNNGNQKMMSGSQLYDYYASMQNADQISFTRWNPDLRNSNFDWWDLATHVGYTQDYNVSFQGGSEKMNGFFSMGYFDEEGAVKGYEYEKYSVNARMQFKPCQWLTLKPAIIGVMSNAGDAQYSVNAMYSMLPWDSPYLEDGSLTPDRYQGWVNATQTNYLNSLANGDRVDYKNYDIMGSFNFDVRFCKYLTWNSTNSYKYQSYRYSSYSDPKSDGTGGKGRISEYHSDEVIRYTSQMLNYVQNWGEHHVTGLLGYEFRDYSYKYIRANGTGFLSGFDQLGVAATPESVDGALSESAKQSVIFKATYDYANRYFAEVSWRRDGASYFGDNNKYGNFGSFSAGWMINREKWFKADWVDLLKLRASIGTNGNDPGTYYPQYDLYSISASYNDTPAALISQIGNKDLTWEKTRTIGVGLDASLFNSRLRFNFDWYNKYTDNILYMVPLPGIVGVTSRWKNVGEMSNNGIEITLGGDIVRTHDWKWSLDLTLGHNANKVEKLYGDNPDIQIIKADGIAGGANKLLKPGYSCDTFYLQEWAGVNTETGAAQWYYTAEDGSRQITTEYAKADQVICDPSTPKVFGGFQTELTWREFSLAADFGYSIGGKIFNYSRLEFDSDGAYTDRNQMVLKDGWTRWEKPGDVATHPVAIYNNSTNSNKASTRFLEDGDFLKLRSLVLAWDTDRFAKRHISHLRIALSGENLFCVTPYSGVDPELPPSGGKVISSTGVSVYPSVRKFMLNVNLSF